MSDSGNDAGPAAAAATSGGNTFTEREMQMLAWAMQSLKSGPPEIDYEKLASYAGMTNPRSAGNAWAKIRNKLNITPGDAATPKATPKKTPQKKKAIKTDKVNTDDGEEAAVNSDSPKKSPRKRTPKKAEVDGEPTTPKKRGRPAKAKKASEDEDSGDTTKQEAPADVKMEDANANASNAPEKAKCDGEAVQEEV